ncbi:MAG: recombinase family protein [Candidatus Eremiobacteraeota bacterium]|nr:recombinase family protein [Candidatus Eremiobacteraeota bacterium]
MSRKKQPLPPPRRVVGYTRVSTEEQSREGVSLMAQETRIKAFCVASGRAEPEIVTDEGQSAKSLKRGGLQTILAAIRRREIASLVVLKLDRLTRSVRDLGDLLETFERYGCSLVAVEESLDTSTASGRLMLNIMGSVSQWEREAISERTAAAFAYKRENRQVYCKSAPFGFRRKGGTLVEVSREIDAIRLMQKLALEGHSLRQIARVLTEQEISPSGGGIWYAQSVKVVLGSKMTAAIS